MEVDLPELNEIEVLEAKMKKALKEIHAQAYIDAKADLELVYERIRAELSNEY